MSEKITIMDYIQAAGDLSKRSRRVVYIMSIASLLIFIAFWNSRDSSWINSRYQMIQESIKWYEDQEKIPIGDSEKRIEHILKKPDYIKKRDVSIDELKDKYDMLSKTRHEKVAFVNVPFFGFTIDVNDLGMLGGFTLVLILLVLHLSMQSELNSLKFVFEHSKNKDDRVTIFNFVAMNQILTIPPVSNNHRNLFWNILIKALYLLPFIIQLLIVSNDFLTFSKVVPINTANAIIGSVFSSLFLLLCGILSYRCIYLSIKIDNLWLEESKSIKQN